MTVGSQLKWTPAFVRRMVELSVSSLGLHPQAERDVLIALAQVPSHGQLLFVQLAHDAAVPESVALQRLACLWISAAAINLADDLADGDCHYLPPRVAPGVSFLLQALTALVAARCKLSLRCVEAHSAALTRAASGQSLEVRTRDWNAARYLEVAGLIAGEQYAAHLGLLWDGTAWETRAGTIGRALGITGILVTDVDSADQRFVAMSRADRAAVLRAARLQLSEMLEPCGLSGLTTFCALAQASFARADASCVLDVSGRQPSA